MAASGKYVVLHHGRTRKRAEAILRDGPNPRFREPGSPLEAEGFSAAFPEGPFASGSPKKVAERKARLFPNEGGPAILEFEVPEELLDLIDNAFEIRFEIGWGLRELIDAWPGLPRRILES